MTQQTSPFLEGKFGWSLGESGWNLGMDENLVKFSYMFDRNLDGIISSLPPAVNGTAYFNTTDNRVYFVVGGVYSSSPTPQWFEFTLRSTGAVYQFNGTTLVVKPADTADTAYTNAFKTALLDSSDVTKGVALVGATERVCQNIAELLTLPNAGAQTALTLGYYAPGDGGGATYRRDASDVTTPSNGGTVQVSAAGGRWKFDPKGIFNVKQFGAKADDLTDNQASFNAAALAAVVNGRGTIYYPPGIYRQSGTTSVPGGGIVIRGESREAVTIKNTSAGLPTFLVPTSSTIWIMDFTLDRTVPATAGGNGISFGVGGVADGAIYRIHSKNNRMGIQCGGCSYGIMEDCFLENNYVDGLNITNSNAFVTSQWYVSNLLSQGNGRDGFHIESVATAGGTAMSVGELNECRSFANSGFGLSCIGTATVGLYSMRIKECFFGGDGVGEIYLDTYGNLHQISGCYLELAGRVATGRNFATAISNVGHGIQVTANNSDAEVFGGVISGCAESGILSNTPHLKVVGTQICNNGQAAIAAPGSQSGIIAGAGVMEISGVTSGNTAGTFQKYGIYDGAAGGHTFVGNNLNNNGTGAFGGVLTNCIRIGNSPAIGTGWTAATGTATRTTFATSTVTLPILAEHVKALTDDLLAQGILKP